MERVAIIGGGASALMCACFCGADVTIFEKQEKFGKKILATGNGRCNITNKYMNKCSYNIDIQKYLARFNQFNALDFFKDLGLETYFDEEGRAYPISDSATSVLSVLKNYLENKKNVKINSKNEVFDVTFDKKQYKLMFSDGGSDVFDKVVVASGNYTNLKIFDKFGIAYKEFKPSLCALKTEKHKNLAGVRVKANVKCLDADFEEFGEVLFREDGVSGIVIFNLSARLARKNLTKAKLQMDVLPKMSNEQIFDMLNERRNNLLYLKNEEFLTGLFHKQINFEIMKRAKIDLTKSVKTLSDDDIKNIAKIIKNFEFDISGFCDNNQVCTGGIVLDELDNNLQSKKREGLYFIGECVDVDGVCGGYNLQWAWTSGKIVGERL